VGRPGHAARAPTVLHRQLEARRVFGDSEAELQKRARAHHGLGANRVARTRAVRRAEWGGLFTLAGTTLGQCRTKGSSAVARCT